MYSLAWAKTVGVIKTLYNYHYCVNSAGILGHPSSRPDTGQRSGGGHQRLSHYILSIKFTPNQTHFWTTRRDSVWLPCTHHTCRAVTHLSPTYHVCFFNTLFLNLVSKQRKNHHFWQKRTIWVLFHSNRVILEHLNIEHLNIWTLLVDSLWLHPLSSGQ